MLQIFLLGRFCVKIDGVDLPEELWTRRKAKNLLKLLALQPHYQLHKEQVIDCLWPEIVDRSTAHSNLYRILYILRHTLEPHGLAKPTAAHYIRLKDEVLQLGPPQEIWVDLTSFESLATRANCDPDPRPLLEHAVHLYQGDLLHDDLYCEWALPQRERLRRSYSEVLLKLVAIYRQSKNYSQAIVTLQRSLAQDNLDEAVHQELMECYARAGLPRQALKQYRLCAQVLQAELELEPALKTTELFQQIQSGAFKPDPESVQLPVLEGRKDSLSEQSVDEDWQATANIAGEWWFTTPNNLPAAVNALIGRTQEVARVLDLLRATDCVRLLTLCGPGGIGKTRLGLQVAAELLNTFEDGVYFVPLAALPEPQLVTSAIAQALKVSEVAGQPLEDTLKEYLRSRRVLLLLDNFEHLLPASSLVAGLLSTAPGLKIIITSRELLHLYGENELPVGPLEVPDHKQLPELEDLRQNAAVRMFIERARSSQPHFELTGANARLVAGICRRLEGFPLAIELAAGRVKLLSLETLLDRLNHRFDILTGGPGNLPQRQRTLRATLDWSYDLLSPSEKALLRRLSGFTAGCTMTMAEEICAGEYDGAAEPLTLRPALTLNLLQNLVDKSFVMVKAASTEARPEVAALTLVQVEDSSSLALMPEARYTMLETIREYALDKLEEAGEARIFFERQLEWFLAMVEETELKLRGLQQAFWLNRLECENDNLRATLARAISQGKIESATRLGGVLWWFWWRRGYLAEGQRWLEAALFHLQSGQVAAPVRAKGLHALGGLVYFLGDWSRAQELWRESLQLKRELDDKRGVSYSLNNLGIVALRHSEYERARILLEESLTLKRELGVSWEVAHTLNELATLLHRQGDYAAALILLDESTNLFEEAGDKQGLAHNLHLQGKIALGQDQLEAAQVHHQESLRLAGDLNDCQGMADALNSLGGLAMLRTDYGEAERLLEQGRVLFGETGDQWGLSYSYNDLGLAALFQGDGTNALTWLLKSLELKQQLGDQESIGWTLEVLAATYESQGNKELAASISANALAIRDTLGTPLPPPLAAYYRTQSPTILQPVAARYFPEPGLPESGLMPGFGRRPTVAINI